MLAGLAQLRFRGISPELSFVIVDNDPAGSAAETCDAARPSLPGSLNYVIEPRPGIAFARNAALDNSGDSEWLCFLDDDEVPDPLWLDELLRVQKRFNADVVGGPVLPQLPADTPDWLIDGGFFDRNRHPTGTRLGHAFTNNVLFRRRILDELKLRFDERWALMGCEDHAFFQTIGMAGYRIIWADDALVIESIPPSRANPNWLVQRHYRVGNSTAFVELDLRPRWKLAPLLIAKSAVWIVIGAGLFVGSVVGRRVMRLRARRCCAYAAGMFMGVCGVPYEEYRKRHAASTSANEA